MAARRQQLQSQQHELERRQRELEQQRRELMTSMQQRKLIMQNKNQNQNQIIQPYYSQQQQQQNILDLLRWRAKMEVGPWMLLLWTSFFMTNMSQSPAEQINNLGS